MPLEIHYRCQHCHHLSPPLPTPDHLPAAEANHRLHCPRRPATSHPRHIRRTGWPTAPEAAATAITLAVVAALIWARH